jgi:succinate dehydrogenase / fumarate reductase flavoprotein subunit
MGSNATAAWKIHKKRFLLILATHKYTLLVSPFQEITNLTLMSESLRNDGRIWVPAKLEDAQAIREGKNQQICLKQKGLLFRKIPCFW